MNDIDFRKRPDNVTDDVWNRWIKYYNLMEPHLVDDDFRRWTIKGLESEYNSLDKIERYQTIFNVIKPEQRADGQPGYCYNNIVLQTCNECEADILIEKNKCWPYPNYQKEKKELVVLKI